MQAIHADDIFFQSLQQIDYNLSIEVKAKGCLHCGSPLDIANIPRKPRGLGEKEEIRFSLCCRKEGCRKRSTPPSLRFYKRKVYPALVVILAVNFCKELGLTRRIARQTLARWRNHWKEQLAESSPFMKWARSFLPPGLLGGGSPYCFVKQFEFPHARSLVPILRFFTQQI